MDIVQEKLDSLTPPYQIGQDTFVVIERVYRNKVGSHTKEFGFIKSPRDGFNGVLCVKEVELVIIRSNFKKISFIISRTNWWDF